jgi:hypothetical protein
MTCEFPGCKSHPQKNGYCIGHRIYAKVSVKEMEAKEKAKPIAKRSEKMKETMKPLKKDYTEFLAKPENQRCKLQIDNGCTKQATVVHHLKGRTGKNLTDQHFWLPSCPHCNTQIENKDAEARQKGLKLSKHEPNYKRVKY